MDNVIGLPTVEFVLVVDNASIGLCTAVFIIYSKQYIDKQLSSVE